MKNQKPIPDSRISHEVEKLMGAFDALRYEHRNCQHRMHYVRVSGEKLSISHFPLRIDSDIVSVFSAINISGDSVSESQREALRNRLKALLKGEL